MMRPLARTLVGVTLVSLPLGIGAACRQAADPNLIRLNGRIEAPLVDLAPKVTGRVREVLVREGDRVKAGDLLVRLDLGETGLAVDRDQSQVRIGRGARARPRAGQPHGRDRGRRGGRA